MRKFALAALAVSLGILSSVDTAHAADDVALRDTDAQTNAKQIIARFIAMEARNDTEAAYLACAQAIVLASVQRGESVRGAKEGEEDEKPLLPQSAGGTPERKSLLASLFGGGKK